MLGLGYEDKLLAKIVKNTGESVIVSSRISPRVFLHIGLKCTSYKEDSLVEMCILLSLVILGPCIRGAKCGKQMN